MNLFQKNVFYGWTSIQSVQFGLSVFPLELLLFVGTPVASVNVQETIVQEISRSNNLHPWSTANPDVTIATVNIVEGLNARMN